LFKKLDHQTFRSNPKLTSISLNFALSKAKSQCYYRFLYLSSQEIVNGCKTKKTTALKYCKSEQIKATMVKRTRQNRFCTETYRIGLLTLLRHAHTGLLFISPPKRSDFYAASRTGFKADTDRTRFGNATRDMQSK
jgi:hypothetical protein